MASIGAIGGLDIARDIAGIGKAEETGGAKGSFAGLLDKSMTELNDMMSTADKKVTNMATGKPENLHDAMISIEKAETALKFVMQVRNKALEAYHEVMRMAV